MGVVMLVLLALRRVYRLGAYRSFPPLLTFVAIFLCRWALKSIVLAVYEFDATTLGALLWTYATRSGQMVRLGIRIMREGAAACKHPDQVLPVFRVCAVMQWIAFWALSMCF